MTVIHCRTQQVWSLPEFIDLRYADSADRLPTEQRFTCCLVQSLAGYIRLTRWMSSFAERRIRDVNILHGTVGVPEAQEPDIRLIVELPDDVENPELIARSIRMTMEERTPKIMTCVLGHGGHAMRPSSIILEIKAKSFTSATDLLTGSLADAPLSA